MRQARRIVGKVCGGLWGFISMAENLQGMPPARGSPSTSSLSSDFISTSQERVSVDVSSLNLGEAVHVRSRSVGKRIRNLEEGGRTTAPVLLLAVEEVTEKPATPRLLARRRERRPRLKSRLSRCAQIGESSGYRRSLGMRIPCMVARDTVWGSMWGGVTYSVLTDRLWKLCWIGEKNLNRFEAKSFDS